MPAKNNNTLDLFEASVRREFAFLERDFAFPTPTRVPCDGGCVIRYLSPKVRVDLCYGAPEFEVILAFARADGGEKIAHRKVLAGRRDDPVPAAAAATDGGVPGQVQFFARLLRQLGEPLLRGDIARLVRHAYDHGLSNAIDTNGLLLNEARARALAEAGISNINVSLDSPDARRHDRLRRVSGSFAAALNAVRTCAAWGIPCVVSTYLTDRAMSGGRLDELIGLARSSGASAVRALFPIYTGKLRGRRRGLLREANKRLFFEKYADPSFVYSESPLYDYLSGSVECTARNKMSVYVGADGSVRTCYTSKKPLGNVRTDGLAHVLRTGGCLDSGKGPSLECGVC